MALRKEPETEFDVELAGGPAAIGFLFRLHHDRVAQKDGSGVGDHDGGAVTVLQAPLIPAESGLAAALVDGVELGELVEADGGEGSGEALAVVRGADSLLLFRAGGDEALGIPAEGGPIGAPPSGWIRIW